MFRAIGLGITLYFLSVFFSNAFHALDSAATESLQAIEAAAVKSQERLDEL